MPSTYTLNNGIELIATGEQSGTWGDTTNTNLQLLDTALDGQVTFTLTTAGSSGSPTALPIADGVSANSEGRNRLVIVNDGGDLGATAYVQLTPNDAEKIIYIRNDLSGSRSLILFQGTYSASRDYEVPAGTTAVVYFTGGGSGAAVAANVFNNAYFDSLRLGSVSVDKILDEDNMASDDASALATQQSIKAYVDSQVTAQDLDFAGDSGTGAVDLDSQTFTVAGTANEIETSASGQTLTVGLPDDVTVATSVTTTTIKASNIDANDGTAAINIADSTGAVDIDTSLNVDGTITSDGLTVDGDAIMQDANPTLTFRDTDGTSQETLLRQLANTFYISARDDSNDGNIVFQGFGGGTGTDRVKIAANGDITFYDASGSQSFVYDEDAGITVNDQQAARDFTVKSDNNASMLVVDGTNDRVGIGQTPASALDVNGTITGDGLTIDGIASIDMAASTGTGLLIDSDNNAAVTGPHLKLNSGRANTGAYNFLTIANSAGTKLSIDGRGGFELTPSTNGAAVFNSGNADANFQVKSENQDDAIFVDAANDTVGFFTTDSAPADSASAEGTAVIGNGQLQVSKNGATPMKVNRIGTDGDLVRFHKAGSSNLVGVIGTTGGSLSVGKGDTAILFNSSLNSIYPWNVTTQAIRDADIDLGKSNTRFKTAWLSDAVAFNEVKQTTTATTEVTLETFAHADHDGAKVVITAATSADTYVTELLIATNGTTAVATEYGQVGTGSALATYDVDISGDNVRIRATPASTTSTTFRVAMTLT